MPKEIVVTVTCDICGEIKPLEECMNFMGVIGVVGLPGVVGFQQDHEEGWACTPEHWIKMAHNDVEHLYNKLVNIHNGVSNEQ